LKEKSFFVIDYQSWSRSLKQAIVHLVEFSFFSAKLQYKIVIGSLIEEGHKSLWRKKGERTKKKKKKKEKGTERIGDHIFVLGIYKRIEESKKLSPVWWIAFSVLDSLFGAQLVLFRVDHTHISIHLLHYCSKQARRRRKTLLLLPSQAQRDQRPIA